MDDAVCSQQVTALVSMDWGETNNNINSMHGHISARMTIVLLQSLFYIIEG